MRAPDDSTWPIPIVPAGGRRRVTLAARALLGRALVYHSSVCVLLRPEDLDEATFSLPAGFEARPLTDDEVRAFARDKGNGIEAALLERTLAERGECFAILEGGRLASYTFYSVERGHLGLDFDVHVPEGWVYAHSAFTLPAWRGRRLQGIGKTLATRRYADRGYRGVLSVIERWNIPALRSNQRLGARAFGTLRYGGRFGRWLIHVDEGCRRMGFWISPVEGQDAWIFGAPEG